MAGIDKHNYRLMHWCKTMNTFKACLTLLKHDVDSYVVNSKWLLKEYYINTGKFQGKIPFINAPESIKPLTC